MTSWSECESIIQEFKAHYTLLPPEHELVYKYAMEIPAGGIAMELGICYGRTAAVLAYCAREKGFEAHGIDAFFLVQDFDANMLKAKLTALNLPYTVHDGLTTDTPISYRSGQVAMVPWDRELDLLIIDASHNDAWVSADFKRWIPFVKIGGVGIFDDIGFEEDSTSPHNDAYLAAHKYTDGWQEEFHDGRLLIRRRI